MPKPRTPLIAVLLILCLIAGFQAASFVIGRVMEPRVEEKIASRLNASVELEGFKFGILRGMRADHMVVAPADPDETGTLAMEIKGLVIHHAPMDLIAGKYRVTGIEIQNLDASANPAGLRRLLRIQDRFDARGRLPKIEIHDGNIRLDHPALGQGLQISRLSAKTLENGRVRIQTQGSFDNGKNRIHADITVMPGQSAAEARLSVSDFAISCLPRLPFSDFSLDLSRIQGDRRINGRIFARFCAAAGTLVFSRGRFETQKAGVTIPSAGLDFEKTRIRRAWFDADVRKMDLRLLDQLNAFAFVTEQFRPKIREGIVNAGIQARWTPAIGLNCNANLTLESGSAVLPQLDTRIDSIDADISASLPGRIHLRQLQATAGKGRLNGSGHLTWDVNFQIKNPLLKIDLVQITPNEQIEGLLPEEIRQPLKRLGLQNPGVNGTIFLSGQNIALDLGVYAQSARLPDLPFSLDTPSAGIEWKTGEKTVRFENVEARIDGKPLKGSGKLYIRSPVCADFTLFGKSLPITREILDWLNIDTRPWEIEGGYDLELRAKNWRSEPQGLSRSLSGLEASIDVRDLSVSHPEYGPLADGWYGHLALDKDRMRLADFRGNIFNTGFAANGFLPVNGSQSTRVRLESRTITVNEPLQNALPRQLSGLLKKFDVRGQCELQADLVFENNNKIPSSASVTAVLHYMKMETASVQTSGSGSIRADVFGINTENPYLEGFAELSRAAVGRFETDRLSASFRGGKERLEIPDMKVNAYGGSIRFADVLFYPESRNWEARIMPAHVDVETLAGAFGITGRQAPAGSLRGRMALAGIGFDPEKLEGSGEIKIDRGRLYQFPVVASVFRVLDLQMPRQSPITDAYGTFQIHDGQFDVEDLLLLGGTMPMHASGSVELKKDRSLADQGIDLLVTTTGGNGLLNKIPVISWVKHYTIDWFQRLAFQARVRGTIGDYEVKRLASPITSPIERMWSLMEMLSPSLPEE